MITPALDVITRLGRSLELLLAFSYIPDIETDHVGFCGKGPELRSHSGHRIDVSTGLNHRSGCSMLRTLQSTYLLSDLRVR